jgi:tRNA nucleotidyltransferase (CCA-adding enzyme)
MRRLTFNPNLFSKNRHSLIADVAAQAARLNMPCYLVGGFVRDLLLDKPVNDFDIVVVGDAIQLGDALVKKHGGKLTAHHKFRTAVWFPPPENSETLDLITARSETYEHAGALPTIKPSTIEDDIRRRDFTVNALALRLDGEHFGELLDPLGGEADLAQGFIRALHPRSFVDDPTRIFRAVRYEQRYGFHITPETRTLINQEALDVLSTLSGERIRHEFDLILEEEKPTQIISRLKDLGILDLFHLPEFGEAYAFLLDNEPSPEFGVSVGRILLGYLFWLINSPQELIASISKRLDFNSEFSAAALAISQLKSDLPALQESKPSAWTFHLEKFPPTAVYALWLATKESALKDFLVKWRHIKPIVTGNDLKARGIPTGPKYKEILTQLRAAWLDGKVNTSKQEDEFLKSIL